jgi:hypothetical protein
MILIFIILIFIFLVLLNSKNNKELFLADYMNYKFCACNHPHSYSSMITNT